MADEIETDTPNTSRRESLAAAMATLEAGGGEHVEAETPIEEAAPEVEAAPVDAAPEEKPAGRDDKGRFAPKAGEEKPAAEAKPKDEAAAKPAEGDAKAADAKPAAPSGPPRAPGRWKPQAREKWAALDPEIRAEVWRHEKEALKRVDAAEAAARTAQEAAKAGADVYREAVSPFENAIRARGQEPKAFVAQLLQTEHALSSAHPHQRADLLARLVIQYGQDVLRPDQQDPQGNASSPLDRALVALMSGRAPAPAQAQPTQPQTPQQFRDPRLDALIAQQAERAQAAEAQAATEAEAIAASFGESHEFYGDVAGHVADIIDVWGKQGKREVSEEDLEQAYHLACQMNPDVAPIYEQRKAAEAAAKAKASTQRARAASTSVRSAPAPAASPAEGKLSRRESMRRAMEALEQAGRV